jgi:hypothetical protein
MTREQHIVEAERLAMESADYFRSAQQLRQERSPGCSRPHAERADDQRASSVLAQRAAAHATIAVALGQQPAIEMPVHGPWIPEHKGLYKRGPWSLILFDSPSPGRPNVGWYLFGPSLENGYWTCDALTGARATADRLIEVYQANFGSGAGS